MPNGPHRITGLPFEEELYKSEHSVGDAEIQVRVKTEQKPSERNATLGSRSEIFCSGSRFDILADPNTPSWVKLLIAAFPRTEDFLTFKSFICI